MTETLHRCGCVTRWDSVGWRSVAVKRCDGHAEQERLAEAAVAGSATPTHRDEAGNEWITPAEDMWQDDVAGSGSAAPTGEHHD